MRIIDKGRSIGTVYIITDGKAINITWKKDSATDRTKYYLEDGTELKLNVGKTYIAVVPTDTTITLSEN